MPQEPKRNPTAPAMKSLTEILEKLDRVTDARRKPVKYQGVVLGRTEKGLRLAIDIGIVEISTESILEITSIRDDRPEVVAVSVRDTFGVSEILRVEPLTGFSHDSLPGL